MKFFCGLQSRAAYNRGRLTFFQLIKTSRWRPVFPWLRFVYQTLFSHYVSSPQHHAHIRHRMDYDEQKAVVLVNHHYLGC